MILLNEREISEIETHGERTYPNECCGLLVGSFDEDGRKTVVEIFSIENAREESARHNRSLITPQDLMRGERYARERKLDVVGNYHSHPDHPAVPSQFDLDHALPVWTYLIVSVSKGKAVDARAWEMENDRSKFNEEEIKRNGTSLS
ncbi:MAG: M67 family metallopeptidase [Acidobacteriota bacterium]|nr:M67 family metallopeptidase [Acidobacteriota bacterium]